MLEHPRERPVSNRLSIHGLIPKQMTQANLAARLGLPIQRINTIVNKKRGITSETALLFAKVFETSPEFWMHLQMKHDLWIAARRMAGS